MSKIKRRFAALREFVWPSYHPELHYMRGPGPACRKRQINLADSG